MAGVLPGEALYVKDEVRRHGAHARERNLRGGGGAIAVATFYTGMVEVFGGDGCSMVSHILMIPQDSMSSINESRFSCI